MSADRRPIQPLTFLVILLAASVVGSLVGLGVVRWRDHGDGAEPTTTARPDASLPTDPEALWLFGSTTVRIDPENLADPRAVPVRAFGSVAGAPGAVDLYSPFSGDFGVLDATENTIGVRSNVPPLGEVDPLVEPAVAPADDAVWVVTGPASVAAVDPASGDELERLDLPASFIGLGDGTEVTSARVVTTGSGAVAIFEVSVTGGGSAVGLARLHVGSDPTLGAIVERSTNPVVAVAGASRAVWVIRGTEVTRVDADTLEETGSADVGEELGEALRFEVAVVADEALWLLDRARLSLIEVTDQLEIASSVVLPVENPGSESIPGAMTAGAGSVYVLLPRADGSTLLTVVDAATAEKRQQLGFPRQALLAAVAFSSNVP